VVNAQQVKHIKGNKSDKFDSFCLVNVVRHGLLKPNFVLLLDFLYIQTHARLRQNTSSDLARAKNRIDEILSESGIRYGLQNIKESVLAPKIIAVLSVKKSRCGSSACLYAPVILNCAPSYHLLKSKSRGLINYNHDSHIKENKEALLK
jgi:hypothetical protein